MIPEAFLGLYETSTKKRFAKITKLVRDHLFSRYAKFSEKHLLAFDTHTCNICVRAK